MFHCCVPECKKLWDGHQKWRHISKEDAEAKGVDWTQACAENSAFAVGGKTGPKQCYKCMKQTPKRQRNRLSGALQQCGACDDGKGPKLDPNLRRPSYLQALGLETYPAALCSGCVAKARRVYRNSSSLATPELAKVFTRKEIREAPVTIERLQHHLYQVECREKQLGELVKQYRHFFELANTGKDFGSLGQTGVANRCYRVICGIRTGVTCSLQV